MTRFKVNDVVFFYTNKYLAQYNQFYTVEEAFQLYGDNIETFLVSPKELYSEYLYKIKKIEPDHIILDGGLKVKSEHYMFLYYPQEVEKELNRIFGSVADKYIKIKNKANEIEILGNDIAQIASSLGISNLATSDISDSIYGIKSVVDMLGWRSSSLGC